MSHVTGVYLQCRLSDRDLAGELVRAHGDLLADGRGLEEHFLGNKHPQLVAWGAGINGFDPRSLIDEFVRAPWEFPEGAILVLQPEDGRTIVYRPDRLMGQLAGSERLYRAEEFDEYFGRGFVGGDRKRT